VNEKKEQCPSVLGGRLSEFGVRCELKDFHTGSHEGCGATWRTNYGAPISERGDAWRDANSTPIQQ
jgi:hypothetical protein